MRSHAWVPGFLWTLAVICVVTIAILVSLALPEILERFDPEYGVIDVSSYSNQFEVVNKRIEEGWVVTEIGHDSCGNTYVYIRR